MLMHFSRCGARRAAASLRKQLGHLHSIFFTVLFVLPKMSAGAFDLARRVRINNVNFNQNKSVPDIYLALFASVLVLVLLVQACNAKS